MPRCVFFGCRRTISSSMKRPNLDRPERDLSAYQKPTEKEYRDKGSPDKVSVWGERTPLIVDHQRLIVKLLLIFFVDLVEKKWNVSLCNHSFPFWFLQFKTNDHFFFIWYPSLLILLHDHLREHYMFTVHPWHKLLLLKDAITSQYPQKFALNQILLQWRPVNVVASQSTSVCSVCLTFFSHDIKSNTEAPY